MTVRHQVNQLKHVFIIFIRNQRTFRPCLVIELLVIQQWEEGGDRATLCGGADRAPARKIAHTLTLCIVSDKSIMTVRKYPHTLSPLKSNLGIIHI